MSETFNRVTSGMPVSRSPSRKASWLNAVTESARYHQEQVRLGKSSNNRTGSTRPLKVRNTTGEDRLRGSVVELGDSLLTDMDPRYLWFEGDSYADGPLALLQQATKDDEIGPAVAVGETIGLVNVTSTEHRFAEPAEGEAALQSAESGSVRLLTTPSETGEQELAVLLGSTAPGGTAEAGQRVMIYGGTTKSGFSGGVATVQPVPYLPCTQSGGTITVDTTGPVLFGYPASLMAVSLDDSDSCCGSGGSGASYTFATLEFPVAANNRIEDGEDAETALVLRAYCDPSSTLSISAIQGSSTKISADIVPIQTTGECVATFNLTTTSDGGAAFTKGPFVVRLSETLVNQTTTLPNVDYVLSYEDNSTQSQALAIANRPAAPQLLDGSGNVIESGITEDQTPNVRLTYPAANAGPDGTGPTWRIFVDGVAVDTGVALAFDTTREVEVTLASLSYGDHIVQWGAFQITSGTIGSPSGETFLGGLSDPLYLRVSENADDETAAPTVRLGRPGFVQDIVGGTAMLWYDGCSSEISDAEIALLDNTATITAQATAAFDTVDDPIGFDNWTVVDNPTGETDPSIPSPAEIAQPDPPLQGLDNALLNIAGTHDGSSWTFRLVGVGAPVT